jgi:hypothetical protein
MLHTPKVGWRWAAKQHRINRKKANKKELMRTMDPRRLR